MHCRINNISPSWGIRRERNNDKQRGIVSKANCVSLVAAAASKINKPIKTLFDRSFLLSRQCVNAGVCMANIEQ